MLLVAILLHVSSHSSWFQCCGNNTCSGKINIMTGTDMGGLSGVVLNDASGLQLASQGEAFGQMQSGVFTNLVRLSSQLQHGEESSDVAPLITVETEDALILCKEYHGHCVAATVRTVARAAPSIESTSTPTAS